MKHLALTCALVLMGCAAPPRYLTDEELYQVNTDVECDGAEACARMWRSAQAWIARNSGYRLRLATDAVLETYPPPPYSLSWGYQVFREPLPSGKERIVARPTCGPAPLCKGDAATALAEFNRALRVP